jgi:hypothetical protein
LTPPKDEPVTRRPVIRKRGTTSSTSPLPATPHIVARPHASRAASTAWPHDGDVSRSPRTCKSAAEAAGLRLGSSSTVSSRRRACSVAPWWRAWRSRSSERSIATIRPAPGEARADHRAQADEAAAEDATVEPGSTWAVFRARPIPVERPQANGAQPSSGRLRSHLREAISAGPAYSANVEVPMKCRSGSPSRERAGRAVRQVAEPLLVADRDRSGSCASCGSGRTLRTPARRA